MNLWRILAVKMRTNILSTDDDYSKLSIYRWSKIVKRYSFFRNARDKRISKMINTMLPHELRMRIFIFSCKQFWKNYYPPYCQVSTWNPFKHNRMKELFKAEFMNVHFLHLECNTLPENKQWIMGCQCDYCKNYDIDKKRKHYSRQINDNSYFLTTVPNTEFKWNSYIHYESYTNDHYRVIFDPLYDFDSLEYKYSSPTITINQDITSIDDY
jgi:hypothetical protein